MAWLVGQDRTAVSDLDRLFSGAVQATDDDTVRGASNVPRPVDIERSGPTATSVPHHRGDLRGHEPQGTADDPGD